jgi:formylmethanofuran dehydrogenase subunit E
MGKQLTIREANRLARGRAKVTVDPEDGRLWQVQRPGSVQAHEPMTREAWLAFLETGEVAPAVGEKTAAERSCPMITTKQAETILPTMRAAVAALHDVWEKCREVERALGRDLEGLEGIVQDMAAGVDDPESVDVDYVRDALNAQLDDEVAEADACPRCGERNHDNLVWQDDGKVKCTTCGKRYTPPAK